MKFFRRLFRRVLVWILNRQAHRTIFIQVWQSNSGKIMRGAQCSCGEMHDIRPLPLPGEKSRGKYRWS